MNVKNIVSVALLTGVVVASVGVVFGWVVKELWEPNGMFVSCVAIDPLGCLGFVLGVSAMVLVVWGKVKKG